MFELFAKTLANNCVCVVLLKVAPGRGAQLAVPGGIAHYLAEMSTQLVNAVNNSPKSMPGHDSVRIESSDHRNSATPCLQKTGGKTFELRCATQNARAAIDSVKFCSRYPAMDSHVRNDL